MKARYISLKPLVDWRRKRRPLDFSDLFSECRPVVLEIGFGNGEYLGRRAAVERSKNFVGLEREWQSVWRALRYIARNELSNVRIIKADARWAIFRLFGEHTFSEIYSLFPCPWPKERHKRHRLFSKKFLQRLNNILEPGGRLWIVTDDGDYAKWVIEQSQSTGFKVDQSAVPAGTYGTKYENKWAKAGLKFFCLLTFCKEYECPNFDVKEYTLQTHRIVHFNPDEFRPIPVRGQIVVDFKDCLFDPQQQRCLVRAVVVEDEFVQDFWIEIRKHEANWHIRPASGCGWIPTLGLQKALDAVRDSCLRNIPTNRS